ncbi:hypothetical protein L873DRAFT_1689383 [Choiromyces venosus 120613-1]|uniref:Uncharacterized protein n=1 Tax=Choiromyces venosus 120613-1 TaxID=1336337 RepID=A0A3N4JNJ2_9PEZI|nr:hypothetical protein L873DRAFT_1689383 [Choiromyces venosus 120613-1]
MESPTHSHRAPPPPQSGRRFRIRYLLNHVAALCLSGIMLAAMVLLLLKYESKPVPDWKSITMNSALSWLGVFWKFSLMMVVAECIGQMKWILFGTEKRKLSDLDLIDSASRDPLGALNWMLRFRGGFLVHLGAAFVIASIGFDPAVQQLVSYEPRSVVDALQTATVSTNTNYSPVRGFDNGLILAVPRALLWGAQSSVFGAPIQSSWACPSGNCQYPETVSVGICQVCTEITAQIDRNCTTLSTQQPFCHGKQCFTSGQLCTYSFNNASVGGGQTFIDVRANPGQSTTDNGKVSIPSKRIEMTAMYIQPAEASKSTQSLPVTPGFIPAGGSHVARAFSCGLSFCQQTFRASVTNGKYAETSISTSQVPAYVLPIPKVEDISDTLLNAPLAVAQDKKTNVSTAALFAMSEGLTISLTGSASVITGAPSPGDQISEFHRGLYENLLNKDFSTIISEMALSMSHAIRDDNKESAKGQVKIQVNHLKVHWKWIAWPASMTFLAVIFVISVTIKCYSDKTMVGWLGHSQIAALFLGLETEVRADVDNSGVVGGRSETANVRDFAEKIKLRLGVVERRGEEALRVKFCRRGGR